MDAQQFGGDVFSGHSGSATLGDEDDGGDERREGSFRLTGFEHQGDDDRRRIISRIAHTKELAKLPCQPRGASAESSDRGGGIKSWPVSFEPSLIASDLFRQPIIPVGYVEIDLLCASVEDER